MLRQRIVTALMIALPLLGILLFAAPEWIVVALAIVLLLGAWEWSGFIQPAKLFMRMAYVLFIGGLIGGWYFYPHWIPPYTLLYMSVLWWIAASAWIVFFPEFSSRHATGLIGVLVLVPMWIALVTLAMHQVRGAQYILCLLLLVASTDIGAYFVGRAFGKHKLAPRVSPGKTWEGVAGGLISSMIIAVLAAHWFGVQLLPFVVLSLITAIFSIVGDLTESLFKRHTGLKDSSHILPGHGGVLDRIDSITAAAPVFVYGLIYLNVIAQ
jgi:phosphatidate cytidylyltransferase